MDATRARFSFERDRVSDHVEWAVAAAILAVAVLLGSLLVRELRFAPWSSDSPAQPAVSPVMPREAMSVPALMLAAGREVHVGEPRADAVASLRGLALLNRTEERGPLGSREVRSYQGLTLVFEPFERAGDPRVAAIYLR